MSDDPGATARDGLLAGVRDLLQAVRVIKSDLPTGAVGVLAAIDALGGEPVGGCHVKDLAVRCALDPSTVSRAVAGLVRSGLVARTADPTDGRASVLSVTPRGRRALDEFGRLVDDHLAGALRHWSAEDIAVLSALLRRFSADLMTRTDRCLEVAR